MLKISEEKVTELFSELKEETNNFSKFNLKIFERNPQKIIILRLMLNLSRRRFSKQNGLPLSTMRDAESGERTSLSQNFEKILKVILPKIKSLPESRKRLNSILETFHIFQEMSKGRFKFIFDNNLGPPWLERERSSIKANKKARRTEDEIKISNFLLRKNIPFSEQETIILPEESKAGAVVADFFVSTPKVNFSIETFTLTAKKRTKDIMKRMKKRACLMAHKAFRIKLHKKNLLTVAVVRTNLPEDHQIIEILKEAFDFVILNDISNLEELLKRSGRDLNAHGAKLHQLSRLAP